MLQSNYLILLYPSRLPANTFELKEEKKSVKFVVSATVFKLMFGPHPKVLEQLLSALC